MDPADLKARLAPRAPWQAVDLGTRFYRQWWRPVTLVWLLFTALPYALLAGYACVARVWWPLLLFWWLKPLWERPLLAFFSHALFGDYPRPPALLRRFGAYGLNGLVGQLTWRRLSLARGYLMGIWQLEGSHGERARQRIAVLMRSPGQRAASLTTVTLTLEQFLAVAVLILFFTLVPWRFNLEFSVWFNEQSSLHWALTSLAWYLTLTVTEPLYIAASFALYLNERTRLEGWDLQLGLARIGERRRALGLTQLALAAALLIGAATLQPPPARADTPPADSPKQQVERLLASPDFMPLQRHDGRRLKPSLDQGDGWLDKLLHWLFQHHERRHGETLTIPGWVMDALAGLLVLALVILLIRLMRGGLPGLGGNAKGTPTMPVEVAGLDTRADALPADLSAAVEAELSQGRVRDALALLLRQTLVTLFRERPVALPPGATERDCLEAYRPLLGEGPPLAYLRALVEAWTLTAWAHRPVSAERVRDLLARRPVLDAIREAGP